MEEKQRKEKPRLKFEQIRLSEQNEHTRWQWQGILVAQIVAAAGEQWPLGGRMDGRPPVLAQQRGLAVNASPCEGIRAVRLVQVLGVADVRRVAPVRVLSPAVVRAAGTRDLLPLHKDDANEQTQKPEVAGLGETRRCRELTRCDTGRCHLGFRASEADDVVISTPDRNPAAFKRCRTTADA